MLTPSIVWDATDKCSICKHNFSDHYATYFDGIIQQGCRIKNHAKGKTKMCYCTGFKYN